MTFDPKSKYQVVPETLSLRDFSAYEEEFVVRPPYQRKTVWPRQRQQALLDSIFRRYYVPRLVLREVRLDKDTSVKEVIDGQQRITTARLFIEDSLPLPKTLQDVSTELPGKRYSELSADLRRFVDRLNYEADIVKGIEDPHDPHHQEVAAEIFWRLQLGEPLNYMEVAHARLSSLSRNFVVKFADDIAFDYDAYQPVDANPDKHRFFRLIDMKNTRMQHLALLTRLVLLEEGDGIADLQDTRVIDLIDRYKAPDGIGNTTFESSPAGKGTLNTMNVFYDVFKDDYMHAGNHAIRELRREYFIISIYVLLRHLLHHYVFDSAERTLFREFVIDFHARWSERREDDVDILNFSDHRQQSGNEIAFRDRILRQHFFHFATARDHEVLTKDERRAFNEAERIRIYRGDAGLCQVCLGEGKPEAEARVAWREYEADHVLPHAGGGATAVDNAQVLCRYHNRQKGAQVE